MKFCSFLLLSCTLLFFAVACKNKQEPQSTTPPVTEAPTVADEKPEQTLEDWNAAHAEADSAALLKLYDDTVFYYGRKTSGRATAAAKMKALRQQPGYRQQTEGLATRMSGDTAFISFLKISYYSGAEQRISASIQMKRNGIGWRIIAESDAPTDTLLARFKNISIPEGAVEGDYDGDGVKEATWLVAPKINQEEMECEGPCTARIRFSSPFVAAFTVDNCIGGQPQNLGDLNGDGGDEVGVLHEWFTSCWKGYDVFTYKAGKWRTLVPTISTHCNLWEDGIIPAEKDPKRPGYVLIHYSEMTDDDLVTKTKSIRIF